MLLLGVTQTSVSNFTVIGLVYEKASTWLARRNSNDGPLPRLDQAETLPASLVVLDQTRQLGEDRRLGSLVDEARAPQLVGREDSFTSAQNCRQRWAIRSS